MNHYAMRIGNVKVSPFLVVLVGILVTGIFLVANGVDTPAGGLLSLGHGLIMTAGIWLGCMVIVQYLWRKFPWEFYPVRHLIWEISLITAWTMIYSLILYSIERRTHAFERVENLFMEAFVTLLITYLITAIHELAFFYKQWKHHFSKSVRLEKDNIQAKYETLKTQINPHFLFNSLNSLTSLVDENEAAVNYISDLSEFFRYMLGSRDKELVLVREEINLLGKYIHLQQSRFKSSLDIKVDVPEKTFQFAIPPLVLQMLVENSIKHNVISRDHPLRISVTAWQDSLVVENNLQKKSGISSTGQGLRNIKERYRLFTTREVEIKETSATFRVAVPLLTLEL
jgi:two-component system LytT family sensor kinase